MRVFAIGSALFALTALLVAPAAIAQSYAEEPFIVRCESISRRDHYCPVDTGDGVALYAQISSTQCIEDENWGVDRGGIWVRSGCRADFEVFAAGNRGHGGQSQGGCGRPWQDEDHRGGSQRGERVVCESRDRRSAHCAVRVHNNVELTHQLSSAECRFNQSWGFDNRGIWVDRGCRAEFLVY
ncbi:MAG: DUF3011 domain-containing protein [Pseudomonadota bacterium]|nr:DUF3011 domain-containing protein [Pseudomonadota bacterium]